MSFAAAAPVSSIGLIKRFQQRVGIRIARSSRLGAFLALSLMCVPAVSAQVSATLSGAVTDPSGAGVAGADIGGRNLETGEIRNTQTGAVGRYQAFALPIGECEVRVKKPGFTEQVRTGIHLVVGQVASANLELRVGEINQQIKV